MFGLFKVSKNMSPCGAPRSLGCAVACEIGLPPFLCPLLTITYLDSLPWLVRSVRGCRPSHRGSANSAKRRMVSTHGMPAYHSAIAGIVAGTARELPVAVFVVGDKQDWVATLTKLIATRSIDLLDVVDQNPGFAKSSGENIFVQGFETIEHFVHAFTM